MDNIVVADWYQSLLADLQSIKIEAEFNSRWEKLAGYHAIGLRISTDLNWNARGNGRTLSHVSKSIGMGERVLYRCIQFYKKFPDLNMLPDGKAASWTKVTKLLPAPPDDMPEEPNPFPFENWCKRGKEWAEHGEKYQDQMNDEQIAAITALRRAFE